MSTTRALIADHPDRWLAATRSPFLDAAGDGTLADAAFDRWLAQDHLFVTALVRAWGVLLQTAPRRDMALLVGGMTAFVEELAWMEGIAVDRGIDLAAEPLPATTAYIDDLLRLTDRPYGEAITAMWAVEAAYLQAWDHVAPGAPAFTAYITHWANDDFAAFVDALAAIVDRELPDEPTGDAALAFCTIADHEAAFWRMVEGG